MAAIRPQMDNQSEMSFTWKNIKLYISAPKLNTKVSFVAIFARSTGLCKLDLKNTTDSIPAIAVPINSIPAILAVFFSEFIFLSPFLNR